MCPYYKQRRFDVQYCNQRQFDGQYCKQDRFYRHVLISVLIAEKTLPGTFVKIHITNLKPFKSSDLYGVVYKVIKIKFEQFHSYQYMFTVWTHQTYVVYSIDTSNFGCLQHRPTKLMFFTVRTNQTCAVYCMNALFLCSIQHLMGPYCKQHKLDVSML
jgi:hypothetical protein